MPRQEPVAYLAMYTTDPSWESEIWGVHPETDRLPIDGLTGNWIPTGKPGSKDGFFAVFGKVQIADVKFGEVVQVQDYHKVTHHLTLTKTRNQAERWLDHIRKAQLVLNEVKVTSELLGNFRIRGTLYDIPEMGEVIHDILVLDRLLQGEELFIFTFGMVIPLSEFLDQLKPSEQTDAMIGYVRQKFIRPYITGCITIPHWNQYVNVDRTGFVEELLEDERTIMEFLKLLCFEIDLPLPDNENEDHRPPPSR